MTKRGPRPGTAKKGQPTAVRFEHGLKMKLDRAAHKAGISFSEEVERRLALSFSTQDKREKEFGDLTTYAFCRVLAAAFTDIRAETGYPWHRHPWAFHHASVAATYLLSFLQPPGKNEVPDDAPLLGKLRDDGMGDLAEKVKTQLASLQIGKIAVQTAITMAEASLESDAPAELEAVHGLATILKGRLIAGKALSDGRETIGDPSYSVRIPAPKTSKKGKSK